MFRLLSKIALLLLLTLRAFASDDLIVASSNINGIFVILAQLIVFSVTVIGLAFIGASIAKYKKHKKMPTFVPLQSVVVMFVGGLLLVGIGVLYYYTGEAMFGSDYLSIFEPPDERM